MHPQTLPDKQAATIRVVFDALAGVEPLTFPADTPYEQITDRLRQAFLAADVIDKGHTFDVAYGVELGTVKVLADGEVIEHGSITRIEPKPDYWLDLADDLRQAADRVATLAGTPGKPSYVTFTVCAGLLRWDEASAVPMVNTIAKAFSVEATTEDHNQTGTWGHRATATVGTLEVTAYANVTKPVDVEDTLRARVAELEARLAAGGATRQGVDPIDRRDVANDPWRCPDCHHEAEHRHDTGCAARKDGVRCGCTTHIGGVR
ncbi:hypothetical protein AB0A95_31025 [Micromonospora sp. NPDC049230]|uniref:hypothetical protein n=1 Tax=Micromonospora sp. NPDC049230 TaxID=3155502 RepID=UPI0033C4C1D7